MGKDKDDKDKSKGGGGDKPGRHEDDREGRVHPDTAANIDPSEYGIDEDDEDD